MSTVLSYSGARRVFDAAKHFQFAIPAVNVTGTNSINATLEAAASVQSPVIIQFSHSGAAFFAGKSIKEGASPGAIAGAKHVHEISNTYGVPVLLNTDHASRKLLPWVDTMIAAGQEFYEAYGTPLFTSHMIDLSEEPLRENIDSCKRYLEKLTRLDMYLEIELGVTGGEEDGVDNTRVESERLYSSAQEVAYAFEELKRVSDHFVIAAAFGNVHGVYSPGNVRLMPSILNEAQQFIEKKFQTGPNPVDFVFHGGSGSEVSAIREAISYGVVKMNIDTDVQWAFWDGVHSFYKRNEPYLHSQLGNPNGPEAPNKKYYDGRVWLREGEVSMRDRLVQAFRELNAEGRANAIL